jgi:hypothetical protein
VSPLWRNELAIGLSPRRITLSRGAATTTELLVPGRDPVSVFARLADALRDEGWHASRARVVVADHPWARYVLVPWPAARLDAAGRLEHARFVLGDTFGEAVAGWTVTLADAPPGRPYLACAMPPSVRSSIEDALAPAKIALVSLQPRLVAAFNMRRRRLPADDAWFVTASDDSLAAAHVSGGTWDRVHVARISGDFKLQLDRLLALGRLTTGGGDDARVFVDAPAGMRGSAGEGIEWLPDEGLPQQRASA